MRKLLILPLVFGALLAGGAVRIVQDQCGPFTDVTPGFCPYVLELYYLGITAGTSATTFSPDDPLTRGQAAVFVAKGLDQSLARSSRRAALGQWWTTTPHYDLGLGVTTIDPGAGFLTQVCSDGSDLWATDFGLGTVTRVRASDGRILETWTGATHAEGVLVAMGRVFVVGETNPGSLYMIDPSQPAGQVTTVAVNLGDSPHGIAFDGQRLWTTNSVIGGSSSVSIVTPGLTLPWSVTTVSGGFVGLIWPVYDGTNVWVTDGTAGTLLKLDQGGSILQTVNVGSGSNPVYDGENIWVPTLQSLVVVRASTGVVLSTLTGNGINGPAAVTFDGERILVTNFSADSVSLFNAADFSPIGTFSTGPNSHPYGACSDGVNFWIALDLPGQLARF